MHGVGDTNWNYVTQTHSLFPASYLWGNRRQSLQNRNACCSLDLTHVPIRSRAHPVTTRQHFISPKHLNELHKPQLFCLSPTFSVSFLSSPPPPPPPPSPAFSKKKRKTQCLANVEQRWKSEFGWKSFVLKSCLRCHNIKRDISLSCNYHFNFLTHTLLPPWANWAAAYLRGAFLALGAL